MIGRIDLSVRPIGAGPTHVLRPTEGIERLKEIKAMQLQGVDHTGLGGLARDVDPNSGLKMASIGETLRAERLRRGLQLEQVAAETKIATYYLAAMESNRFDDLTVGTFFRRSFLRQYARLLGLDVDPLLSCLSDHFENLEEPPIVIKEVKPPSRIPGRIVLGLIFVAGIAGMYLFDQRVHGIKSGVTHGIRTGAAAARQMLPHGTASPSPTPTTGQAAREASNAAAPPPPNPPALMHLELRAAEPVWVSINSDGADAYQGTLDTQQSKSFDASARFTVVAGNARGLEVLLNGRPIGPLGSARAVVRLEITPAGFRVVTPPPKPQKPPDEEDLPL